MIYQKIYDIKEKRIGVYAQITPNGSGGYTVSVEHTQILNGASFDSGFIDSRAFSIPRGMAGRKSLNSQVQQLMKKN